MPTAMFSIDSSHLFAEVGVEPGDHEEQHDDSDVDKVRHMFPYTWQSLTRRREAVIKRRGIRVKNT